MFMLNHFQLFFKSVLFCLLLRNFTSTGPMSSFFILNYSTMTSSSKSLSIAVNTLFSVCLVLLLFCCEIPATIILLSVSKISLLSKFHTLYTLFKTWLSCFNSFSSSRIVSSTVFCCSSATYVNRTAASPSYRCLLNFCSTGFKNCWRDSFATIATRKFSTRDNSYICTTTSW